jgi:hypothetical protein
MPPPDARRALVGVCGSRKDAPVIRATILFHVRAISIAFFVTAITDLRNATCENRTA